ncbi:hypothetical protein EVC27_015 [Rhizobium phage RHph_I1_6]|uniref:Uncharacterized protein n=1 Tax=Rhizobium phage RHph_I1_6 TaxID=2509728 RepID=A0A7S5RJN2_9CAUD|nr:hypothetical protein PP745_gp015 [Rhizobium phage RHph_I1_6]QIG76540.1 hypothetical protein EVC27_015 [Rhizobium phage RHph_I1_6]
MKITIEVEIPDEQIQHQSIAEKVASRLLEAVDDRSYGQGILKPQISVHWEFKKFSGSKTNERNPS